MGASPVAGGGDALEPGTGSSLALSSSLVSEGLVKEQLHAVSWIPALESGVPRAQIIAGFPVYFETGGTNASRLTSFYSLVFGKTSTRPLSAVSGFARMLLKCKMNGLPLIWERGGYFMHSASLRNVFCFVLLSFASDASRGRLAPS